MRPKHEITNRLRQARLACGGLTQQELADRVGVTRQTILSIEKGKYSPTIGLALRLAGELGIAVEDLFQITKGGEDV